MKKKLVSMLLALAMVASMTACGGTDAGTESSASQGGGDGKPAASSDAGNNVVSDYKLDKIVMYVDGTLAANAEENRDAFEKQWEEAVGVDLEIVQPDHSGYSDAVGRALFAGDRIDVILLSAGQYAEYASTGILWDMTAAYENASFKDRIQYPAVNERKKIDGKLYGFAPAYGNGAVTYVKKAWLDKVGMKAEDIKDFASYYEMLKKFSTEDPDGDGVNGNTYGLVASGYAKLNEAPYVMYMPEFWQDAYPSFYQDASGKWVDGFQTEASKAAMKRLRQAYVDGVMHPDTYKFSTSDARKSWFSADQVGSEGVFTYWAGNWYQNLTDYLNDNGVDSELVMLPPIKEVAAAGGYINRDAPVWCIIDDGDGDNSREQAIFDAFIDTMMDGDKVQMLWTYGAEDVHWSTKAETFSITTNKGKDNEKTTEYTFEEGQFHLRPNSAGTKLWSKNAIDPTLSLCALTNGNYAPTDLIVEGNKFFLDNCYDAPLTPSGEKLTEYNGDIVTAREKCLAAIVQEGKDVETAMAEYVSSVGYAVDEILEELNNK